MSSSYTIQQGDHLSSIAKTYGFRSYTVIWNHAQNAALKKKRVNPNVLFPGDVLFIPDKKPKDEDGETTAVHLFRLNVPKLKLRVVIRGRDSKPIPNANCELEIDGAKQQLQADGDGLVEKPIPATATGGTLRVPDFQIEAPIKIGHLDPIDEQSGLTGRLANLGYYRGDLQNVDPDELASAIEEFQCDQKITVDGKFGPQTMAKLKEVHGC